jgi:hypothetical protein
MAAMTTEPNKKMSRQTWFLLLVLVASFAVMGYVVWSNPSRSEQADAAPSRLRPEQIPFDGDQAYEYLKQICALGPRISGTPAMIEQQKMLASHFDRLGGKVSMQEFRVHHPQNGTPVTLANLVVEWHPDRKERVLLCAHYDTRPFPDRDPKNPQGVFIGANDGASGAALLMELGKKMPQLQSRIGVDFVLFDGEEFVYRDADLLRAGDPYFLGSEFFARKYVAQPPGHKYRFGVLLDMVADADLQIYQERNSMSWRDTRPLVADIWETARQLGVREFIPQKKYEIKDDHLRLHNIAGIPTCDIIDFDYPAWHTEGDTPDKCSGLSLAKVGWVVQEWLLRAERLK